MHGPGWASDDPPPPVEKTGEMKISERLPHERAKILVLMRRPTLTPCNS